MKLNENAMRVLKFRYLRDGETPEQMIERVARTIASVEKEKQDRDFFEDRFREMMDNLDFLPNTPTLINAGKSLGQLAACFVIPIEDSIPEIFESIKSGALIHKSGGGTGFSFSRLRPRGSAVKETGGIASGPVSFLRVFDAATREMKQGGVRRGANMGILRIDHPDIEEFIDAKKVEGEISNFNLSVAVTDEFMECLTTPKPFNLKWRSKTIKQIDPSDLWKKICEGAWLNGEPGIIFIDKINEVNPLNKWETIEATNPCAEQPLPPWGTCVLGSINLSNFVVDTKPDLERLRTVAGLATRFLDNCIDATSYPLKEIKKEAMKTRRIGLGIMGLADMMIKCRIRYDSQKGFELAKLIMQSIQEESTNESIRLGKIKGIPTYLSKKKLIVRNAARTTIAPTGSISLIAGCSSGCEPIFSFDYSKQCIDSKIQIKHPLLEGFGPKDELPEWYITAPQIEPIDHVKMQSVLQKYVDSGISKTINAPPETTVEEIDDVFRQAYYLGVKSITFYREGSRKIESQVAAGKENGQPPPLEEIMVEADRPSKLSGTTTAITTGRGKLYVTINELDNIPYEVFLSLGKSGREDFAYSEAIGRLISIALRNKVPVQTIIKHLRNISGHDQVFDYGTLIKSVPDAVAFVLGLSYGHKKDNPKLPDIALCPDCGADAIEPSGGNCITCMECGWSKCA